MPKLRLSSKAAATDQTTERYTKPTVGTGERAKSTMRGPALSTLSENTATSVWDTPKDQRTWQTPTGALTTAFANVGISTRSMDPSNAPGLSQLSAQYDTSKSRLQTQLTVRDVGGQPAQWIRTEVCVRAPYSRRSFRRGMVLTLPFHVANLNDKATDEDECLAFTIHGPVYSKRRMALVLWRHKTDMVCVPLYSWNKVGILKQPKHLRDEFMEITNVGDGAEYEPEGPNLVLKARMARPFDCKSAVHVSGTFRVNYQEDIACVGELTDESLQDLTNLANSLIKITQEERY